MPLFDRTGPPEGTGPMTGRRRGFRSAGNGVLRRLRSRVNGRLGMLFHEPITLGPGTYRRITLPSRIEVPGGWRSSRRPRGAEPQDLEQLADVYPYPQRPHQRQPWAWASPTFRAARKLKARSTTVPGPLWAVGQTEPTGLQRLTSLLPALQTAGRQYEKAAPLLDFVLEHPWIATLLMGAWMTGCAALGAHVAIRAESK